MNKPEFAGQFHQWIQAHREAAKGQLGPEDAQVGTMPQPDMKPINRGRIFIVETVYYQHPTDAPITSTSRYGRVCDTVEEPYRRKMPVTEEWQQLDKGWLGQCSILSITNREGQYLQTIPTVEEKADIAKRIVQIGMGYIAMGMQQTPPSGPRDMRSAPVVTTVAVPTIEPMVELRPGESARFRPVDLGSLYIRCLHGTASCMLLLTPV